MISASQRHPFYQKFAYVLIIVIALGYLLYIGQTVLSPLLLSLLFTILLRPVALFLNQKLRFPNALASIVTVALFMLFFLAIFYFISMQIVNMADDWENIKSNLHTHYDHLQSYISDTLNLSKAEQKKVVKEVSKGSMESGKQLVSGTLSTFTETLMHLILMPVYMFLILLYRAHFVKFIYKLFDQKHHPKLDDTLKAITTSVQSYVVGLLFEMIIVSALTSIGLLIIGVKYFFLFGVITGLLNLIPYLGILTACTLTIIASLTGTSDLSVISGIIAVNAIVQFIDNNFLLPVVVSSKVEINPLASIVGIVIGGLIAGISGMFLAIPMMAIIKVVFDRVDALEPWGYLISDDLPKSFKWIKSKRIEKSDVDI